MVKNKSPKNKTLSISVEEGASFCKRCIDARTSSIAATSSASQGKTPAHQNNSPAKDAPSFSLPNITNKTLCGDTFALLPRMPHSFVDLAIVDPPYNLSKKYDGKTFNKISDSSYTEYTSKYYFCRY